MYDFQSSFSALNSPILQYVVVNPRRQCSSYLRNSINSSYSNCSLLIINMSIYIASLISRRVHDVMSQ